MQMKTALFGLMVGSALFAGTLFTQPLFAQQQAALQPNQTQGYGDNQVLKFTYTQNFDCVDQPQDDLNYNGIPAESDPGEMQTPICQVGTQPSINPPGKVGNPAGTTEPLFVLVPMFSVNNDQNPNDAISCNGVVQGTICGTTLGNTLIQLFGAIPEAFKQNPLVYTQCPDPGSPAGTCTMHASRLIWSGSSGSRIHSASDFQRVSSNSESQSRAYQQGHQYQGNLVASDSGSGVGSEGLADSERR